MMTVDQMIEVLNAYKAGKKIQFRQYGLLLWEDCINNEPRWNWTYYDYRVKHEPKVLWVNEYESSYAAHGSEQMARDCLGARALRVAVRYVESPEE